jgi:NAD+ synthase (glutamine-hydrolysing)
MKKIGLIRIATVTPKMKVANTEYNTDEIIKCAKEADKNQAGFILFPELCITGSTCGDLFYQDFLYQKSLEGLKKLTDATKKLSAVVIAGFYFRLDNDYYNCAALIQDGKILGIVPKMFTPDSREFSEARWFAPGIHASNNTRFVRIFDYDVPFGHLIFHDEENVFKVGIEIGQDSFAPISPGSHLALNGAHIIFNPTASRDIVGKADDRRSVIQSESRKNRCAYVHTSCGVHESTTDQVFSGHSFMMENGKILTESRRFERESTITYGEIDYERIKFERVYNGNFKDCASSYPSSNIYSEVALKPAHVLDTEVEQLHRFYAPNPFVPKDQEKLQNNCKEIFSIQAAGLAKRIDHTHSNKIVIGVSGGLDSTLALLVCAETFRLIEKSSKDIIAITMPGFGTTDKTYNNALQIMKLLGVEIREISIKESVLQHFKDIGHDPDKHNVTYENSQARERTQILMDIANMEGGFVVGTGDLSESALGWSTYNGDHMSMYGVNAGVPKTLIRHIIQWVMDHKLSGDYEDKDFSADNTLLKRTLKDIMETPISPELLPPDKDGKIAQKTEDTVGPYVLHDFFIYYTIRYGMEPKKLLFIASMAFKGEYTKDFIKKWLGVFYRRFFAQQFKRSCTPDSPKVGSVGFSPRGDWSMPSDADVSLWLKELEEL